MPGDIGAVVKLKDTHTGNTLVLRQTRRCPFPKSAIPNPTSMPRSSSRPRAKKIKLRSGLATLHEEDPTFLYHVDSELHQTVISGQGELHLRGHLRSAQTPLQHRTFELVQPRIPSRETIKAKAESKYRHKKQTGGAGQFAEVWMRIEPKPRNTDVEFSESLTGQNVDRVFVPSVEKGVMSACQEGVLAGYRIVDVIIDFYDGKMHPVDSKDIAFQIAGNEPSRKLPCAPAVPAGTDSRHRDQDAGRMHGQRHRRPFQPAWQNPGHGCLGWLPGRQGQVPAMELYRYSSVLRSLTGGRGIHTEDFSHYEEMPKEMEQKVIAESKKAKEEAAKG